MFDWERLENSADYHQKQFLDQIKRDIFTYLDYTPLGLNITG